MGTVYAIDNGLSMGQVRILWGWDGRSGGGVLAVSTTPRQPLPHKGWRKSIDTKRVYTHHEPVQT
jgi:hypothetical protein